MEEEKEKRRNLVTNEKEVYRLKRLELEAKKRQEHQAALFRTVGDENNSNSTDRSKNKRMSMQMVFATEVKIAEKTHVMKQKFENIKMERDL